ncbi:hypothetical protein K8I85_04380, partial [bacterium]|nr:hypothetical protein [bacterium]
AGMLAYVQQVGDRLRAVFDAPIGDPGHYVLRLAAADAGPWTTHPDSPLPEGEAVLVWTLSTGSARGPYARIVYADTNGEEVLGSVRIDTVSIGPTLRVFPPWPNPSRSGVRWLVESSAAVPVSFRVLDVTGRVVHGPERMTMQRGREILHWDGRATAGWPAAGGVYFLQVEGQDVHVSERVVVIR